MPVSIIIPCYNEEDIIERVIKDYYFQIISRIDDSELIVVDDHSRDHTYDVLKKIGRDLTRLKIVRVPVNSGHGRAILTGYRAAVKEYVFQVDSDNQFHAKDFWKLYALRQDYDFVLGYTIPH